MSSEKVQVSGGVGFFSLLTILFIGLKLGGLITWSWFFVLAPILIPFIIVSGIMLLALVVGFAKS